MVELCRTARTLKRVTMTSHGKWLVYEAKRDEFMCFWGTSTSDLNAPGVFGAPLYCWSA